MSVSSCAQYPSLCTQITSLEQYRRTLLYQGMGYSPAQIQGLGGMPSQFSLQTGIAYGSVALYDVAPWVLDDWKIRPNLTLSLGLRYEWQNGVSDNRDIAPRIGFAWAPGAGKKGRGQDRDPRRLRNLLRPHSEQRFLKQQLLNGSAQLNYMVTNPNFFQTAVPAGGWSSIAALTPTQNSIYFLDPAAARHPGSADCHRYRTATAAEHQREPDLHKYAGHPPQPDGAYQHAAAGDIYCRPGE